MSTVLRYLRGRMLTQNEQASLEHCKELNLRASAHLAAVQHLLGNDYPDSIETDLAIEYLETVKSLRKASQKISDRVAKSIQKRKSKNQRH